MASGGAISNNLVRFGGEFELDPRAYELRRGGQPLKLERIPMQLLLLLIEQRGQLVTREQIVERIWGKDVFLDTDNSINAAIRKIRQVLKDDPEHPHFVQTLTGRGYRFIAPVEDISSPVTAPPAPEIPSSPADNLLGKKVSHYRIIRMLGGGGMGVVYMAEDLKLGRRVALKFLPAEVGSDAKAFERFEREARAASSLDHPNICSIYQLGEHEGRPFIVMQMLEGRTLREWIESDSQADKKSRLAELLNLAVQITDGLEAAHGKGIIHRDIKPANIFVTTSGQAKILDFGVAQIADGFEPAEGRNEEARSPASAITGRSDSVMTRTEGSLGTPSYLSPEQIRRDKLDARSDLFSFGLVLYEMATGQRAFSGTTTAVIRDAVLRSPAEPPRRIDPELPPDLEKVIRKSLEKEPKDRYQSAGDLRSDLRKIAVATPPKAQPKHLGMWVAAGIVLVGALLLAFASSGLRKQLFHSSEAATADQVRTRPSVAVIGFKNLSGNDSESWISTALAEMMRTQLAAGQRLRVIPGENVARMKIDLSLPASDSYAKDTLGKIRAQLNSDLVVLGSYLATGKDSGGKIRIDLQLQDARNGETISSVSTDGIESDLADLVSRSGATLRQRLGVGDVSAHDQNQVVASVPTNPEAARLYSEGLAKLRTFDAVGARDLFQKTLAIEPTHALTHSALAQAWSSLGYDPKAKEEAKKALDLSANLLREDQLSIEGHYRETGHEWQKAVDIYRMLWGVFPDNLEYGLRLSKAQARAGSGKDALVTIEALTKLPLPEGADPRIDMAEILAADQLGDIHREQTAAARAAEKGRRQGSKIVTANALLNLGSALSALGDDKNAVAALRESQTFFFDVGDQQSAARAITDLAVIARHQSNLDESQKLLESSLEISRRLGNALGVLQSQTNLGNVFYAKGDVPHALAAYQDSLVRSREIGAKRSESTVLNNLASILSAQGRLKESLQMFDETLKLTREMGDDEGAAIALGNISDVQTRRGDLRAAKQAGDEALVTHRKVGDKSYEAYALHQLGLILFLQGDVAAGRDRYQQALALRHSLGEKVTEAESQLLMAQLSLETGDAVAAESAARTTASVFHAEGAFDDDALSHSVLSLALAAQKKLPEALRESAKSTDLLAKSIDQLTHLQVDINDGYVAAVSEAHDAKALNAVKSLEAVREKADHMGFVGLSLEARLRLGEAELDNGKASAGRAHLEQLQTDAQAKGFIMIARKAAAAMKTQSARR